MRVLVRKCLGAIGLEPIARLHLKESFLRSDGWFRSVKEHQAVDESGKPIPWLTYSMVDFLYDRLDKSMTIFEYGAGNSSLFFAEHTKRVTSVEHNPEWYEILSKNNQFSIPNLEVHFVKAPKEYDNLGYHKMAFSDNINEYVTRISKGNTKYDIVVVDGLFRNTCMKEVYPYLSDRGVVILDNTSENYKNSLAEGILHLQTKGFRRIDFTGLAPIYSSKSSTSIFYRDNNCMGI